MNVFEILKKNPSYQAGRHRPSRREFPRDRCPGCDHDRMSFCYIAAEKISRLDSCPVGKTSRGLP